MKKEKIEQHLGKIVTIKLYDGCCKSGVLHKEEDYPNDPNKLKDGGYLLRPCFTYPFYNFHFRKSHIKNIREGNND